MKTHDKPTIPEIRERMVEIACEIAKLSRELKKLAHLTTRRSAIRRAPRRKSTIPSGELKQRVRVYADALPNMHMRDIAHAFGIDQGRVSEILSGLREGRPA